MCWIEISELNIHEDLLNLFFNQKNMKLTKPNIKKWLAFLQIPVLIFVGLCLFQNCQNNPHQLFTKLPAATTGLAFSNQLQENEQFNIIEYLYYYNGGGVAVGDINNDNLPDIFLTANQGENQLYVNQGDFRFKNITQEANVGGKGDWSTGATMADVNHDGFLDIYVCNVGGYKGLKGQNELFINNGNGTFTEQAAAFGLAFEGFSTQAAFLDYDNDGDLDCYLLNHSVHSVGNYGDIQFRNQKNEQAGDKLLRNEGASFVEVTDSAGIRSSKIGYGLGIAVSDVNQDGCLDIYISNDFSENDFLYYNNCDGTFTEAITYSTGSNSRFSMGSDIADFNNDARPDIITLDMKPEKEAILKKSAGGDSYETYLLKNSFGYHYQFPRNHLHVNQGTLFSRAASFSEVGHLAGVDATDWSWSALFTDLDNDGLKDLYITNGILRRPNDLDYLNFSSNRTVQKTASDLEIYQKMPDGAVSNYAFQNQGQLKFENKTKAWGLKHVGYSNGAAYADFDGDGDMDLITNNLNEPVSIYKNNTDNANNYLKVQLQGVGKNRFGVGAKVILYHENQVFYQEQSPTRGFQSCVEYLLNFGLGQIEKLDSVTVIWPSSLYQTIPNVRVNKLLKVQEADASKLFVYVGQRPIDPIFTALPPTSRNITFHHRENQFSDFSIQRLMTHAVSTEGPKIAVGDVNQDGLDDFYIGGAKWQAGQLILQTKEGKFQVKFDATLVADSLAEDTDAAFFDADGDKDLDLYVVSAGNEWSGQATPLLDRLYLNDGQGNFSKSNGLPPFYENGSCVRPADFDGDGDLDLFVGSRVMSQNYGRSLTSYLLQNDGHGHFKNVTKQFAPKLQKIGMVTDAAWADFDNDKDLDLIIVGEWMPIQIFENDKGTFTTFSLPNSVGWWSSLKIVDMDKDGDMDFIVGNHGLNCDLQASVKQPLSLYVHDFDGNGSTEQLLCYYNNQVRYPLASQDELTKQMVGLRKQYLTYEKYANAQIESVFPKKILNAAEYKEATLLASVYVENLGQDNFKIHELPIEAQLAPTKAILCDDFDKDGHLDILLGGNFYEVIPKIGRYDASYGTFLRGSGQGDFQVIHPMQTGWTLHGAVRDLKIIRTADNQKLVLVARNNKLLVAYLWR